MIAALALAFALDDPTPDPAAVASPPPADCSLVDEAAASRILGYAVAPPEESAQRGGTCFFASRNMSEDGSLTYTIVTADSLPMRRQYFRAYSRRCAPAAPGTSNELACRQFIALAQATDVKAYYDARTGGTGGTAVDGLGDSAMAMGNGLFVRRGAAVYELSVVRAGDFDLARTTDLAHALLDRTASAK